MNKKIIEVAYKIINKALIPSEIIFNIFYIIYNVNNFEFDSYLTYLSIDYIINIFLLSFYLYLTYKKSNLNNSIYTIAQIYSTLIYYCGFTYDIKNKVVLTFVITVIIIIKVFGICVINGNVVDTEIEYDFENINSSETNEEAKFCRKCGTQIVSGAQYCKKCGTKVYEG